MRYYSIIIAFPCSNQTRSFLFFLFLLFRFISFCIQKPKYFPSVRVRGYIFLVAFHHVHFYKKNKNFDLEKKKKKQNKIPTGHENKIFFCERRTNAIFFKYFPIRFFFAPKEQKFNILLKAEKVKKSSC
jgi:hypothetical protein